MCGWQKCVADGFDAEPYRFSHWILSNLFRVYIILTPPQHVELKRLSAGALGWTRGCSRLKNRFARKPSTVWRCTYAVHHLEMVVFFVWSNEDFFWQHLAKVCTLRLKVKLHTDGLCLHVSWTTDYTELDSYARHDFQTVIWTIFSKSCINLPSTTQYATDIYQILSK